MVCAVKKMNSAVTDRKNTMLEKSSSPSVNGVYLPTNDTQSMMSSTV